jgi:hypothetical protein
MIRMARPAHPGQFIRMEVIEPLGLSVTKAGGSGRYQAGALRTSQWARGTVSRNGVAGREGLWSKDGYASSYANGARDRAGAG